MASRMDQIIEQAERPLPDTANIPVIRVPSPSGDFLRNNTRVYTVQDVLSNQTLALYKDSDAQQLEFIQAMEDFEKSLSPNEQTRINARGRHTMQEVIEEVKATEMAYKRKATGDNSALGKVRGSLRRLESRTGSLEALLDFVPNQSVYASVVCGGFKMIIRAATRMQEIRESIYNTLATIPDELEKAQITKAIYSDIEPSPRLHKCVSELYVCILKALQHIMQWLSQNSAKRHLKGLFQQNSYSKSLTTTISALSQCAVLVKEEATICQHYRVGQINSKVDYLIFSAETGRMETNALLSHVQQLNDQAEKLIAVHKKLLESSPMYLDVKSSDGGRLLPARSASPTNPASHQARKTLSRKKLLQYLDIDITELRDDMLHTLQTSHALPTASQDRAVALIRHPTLKSWLTSLKHAALLLHGNDPDPWTSGSATTVVSAHLAQSVSHVSGLNCLYWFCEGKRNRDSSISAMMRGLIAQVLVQNREIDLGFVKGRHLKAIRSSCEDDDDDDDDRQEENLGELCDTLDTLLYQLSEGTTTFCILDGVVGYEDRARRERLHYVLERLKRVTAAPHQKGSVFKLLVAHAGGRLEAEDLFEEDETLRLPEEVDGDGMGFSNWMWEKGVGEKVEGLAEGKRKRRS
ncbi:MAG: hypothetical protein M1820_009996 [Bogoriella megaspora]|nr:MAG: hypothetical protein M1820_009996 [Bogoriella megaspora]